MESDGKRVACPRCGTPMEFWVEIEYVEDAKRIKYYYKCPRCGYRLQDAVITLRRSNGGLVIEREEYIQLRQSRVGATRPK